MIALTDVARLMGVKRDVPHNVSVVGGGSLNEAYRVLIGTEPVFVKYNSNAAPEVFEVEAAGLRLLAATQTVDVPEVIAVDAHHLILSWIEAEASHKDRAAERLGTKLALLHKVPAEAYGLPVGNVIGTVQPKSRPYFDAASFYREQRLLPLLKNLVKSGRVAGSRRARLERLLGNLSHWIDSSRSRPSLLHGDLWSGNWIARGEEAVLVDPAVLYGERESELAMTELFGGFPVRFYAAYQETWPLEPDYQERIPLYQLYHLLVHLYLFGESYGAAVDRILTRYVGAH